MDRILKCEIDSALSGKTVKEILKNRFKISSSVMTELKSSEDGVLLNGKKVFVNEKVSEGDNILITIRDLRSDIEESDIPLDVLYEDEDIIAVNKGRSLPIHPSQNHHGDTLANAMMHYYAGERFTFRVITRLDKDTSGVVLLAKNPLSGAILSEQMKNGDIKKEYIAVTEGVPDVKKGIIEAPIKRREESVILRCVAEDGKSAITEYEILKEKDDCALILLRPITGRTHQIRVHLSHIGCPILGDGLYGSSKDDKTLLHCSKISFRHPITDEIMEVKAPVPEDISREIQVDFKRTDIGRKNDYQEVLE